MKLTYITILLIASSAIAAKRNASNYADEAFLRSLLVNPVE
jgi:hypothetical protein